jgi:two-component system phosphate regulon sensor histidine kinase PhoR
METAQVYARFYSEKADLPSFVNTGNDTRITVISADGVLLADSLPLDFNIMENHLDRPEIQAAANGSPATSIRYSETLGVDLIYYAVKIDDGDSDLFLRAAVPVAKIDTYLHQSLPLLVLLLFVVALACFFFIRGMIHRMTKPMEAIENKLRSLSDGQYMPGNFAGSYEEIDKITQNIDEVALVLQNSFRDLRDEKNKLDYILNNIGDGLFVVDENRIVSLINSAAITIFHVNSDVVGKNLNYLTYNKKLAVAVNDCVSYGKETLFEQTLDGRIFFIAVKRLPATQLTTIFLSDVTESRENAKRREEFFANASHELKTPLTAIKGFNELTAIHNRDENISKYIDSITRETDRMLSLIGDMLKLSELENTREMQPKPVSLFTVVNEVQESLSTAINEKSIKLEITGDALITTEPGHIYELVKNLMENAVRYNDQNGSVSITMESGKRTARLMISDNGIGISPEEQTRIFERFYRVEKSRSQRNGGTGLGLSIVKHICALYDWKLSLKSKLGIGTEVMVIFDVKK